MKERELIESGICVSFGEARRLIQGFSEKRLNELMRQKKEIQWGRQKKKIKRLVWPREKFVTEMRY